MKPVLALIALCAATMAEPMTLPKQRFVCNAGYTQQQCDKEMAVLRKLLDLYHAEWLGDWTWILVQSDEWESLMLKVGGNPDSPALSVLSKRQTFFDEALFASKVARRVQLLRVWKTSIDKLALLAVTHEIGHAMCNDSDENRADKRGEFLREGKLPTCKPEIKQASTPGSDSSGGFSFTTD
jgi:hypothetical protein